MSERLTDTDQITTTTASGDEEFLVLIEFSDSNEAKYSQENSNKFKVIEIEQKNPIIQIGNRLYSGEYQNNIGTYLFFNQQQQQQLNEDLLNCSQSSTTSTPSYKYSGKTYKKLILNRIYIKPKDKTNTEEQ